jgi:hypothetical protein
MANNASFQHQELVPSAVKNPSFSQPNSIGGGGGGGGGGIFFLVIKKKKC